VRQYQIYTVPISVDTASISPEMMDGSSASTAKPTNRQMGRPISIIENSILFSNEQVYGNQPYRNRQRLGPRIPLPFAEVTPISPQTFPDMTQGYQPLKNRQVLGPRIPLPLSQTTQQSAVFSIEMFAGNIDTRKRKGLSTRFVQPWMDTRTAATVGTGRGFLLTLWCGR
jgi:hypothetical protein